MRAGLLLWVFAAGCGTVESNVDDSGSDADSDSDSDTASGSETESDTATESASDTGSDTSSGSDTGSSSDTSDADCTTIGSPCAKDSECPVGENLDCHLSVDGGGLCVPASDPCEMAGTCLGSGQNCLSYTDSPGQGLCVGDEDRAAICACDFGNSFDCS